jgi:replicative DNA helicase
MMTKDEIGRKVMEVSQICSEGYTNAISQQFQTEAEQEANRKCAIAASNTGYFILQSLGFDKDEIASLASAYRQA